MSVTVVIFQASFSLFSFESPFKEFKNNGISVSKNGEKSEKFTVYLSLI